VWVVKTQNNEIERNSCNGKESDLCFFNEIKNKFVSLLTSLKDLVKIECILLKGWILSGIALSDFRHKNFVVGASLG